MSAGLKGRCSIQSRARSLKRSMDVAGAIAGLVVAAPVLLVAATAICLTMDHPILISPSPSGSERNRTPSGLQRSEEHCDGPVRRTPAIVERSSRRDELGRPAPSSGEYLEKYTARHAHRHDASTR